MIKSLTTLSWGIIWIKDDQIKHEFKGVTMTAKKEDDLSSMLEKSLEEQLKEIKSHGDRNSIASQALKTFNKVYKSQHKK